MYGDSIDKFNEKTLPSTGKFYSKLQFKNITNDEYNHAKKCGNVLNQKL